MKLSILFFSLFIFKITSGFTKKNLSLIPAVVYVDSSVAVGGNGNAPRSAFKYLQDALSYAEGHKGYLEIRVAKGTYYPDEGNSVTNGDREASFNMLNSVEILGGYPNGFPSSKDRNWKQYSTILSGDINQNNSLKTHQIIKNSYTSGSPLTPSAILNGFIIEKSDGWPSSGGGLYNNYSSPKIQNCVFRNNLARFGGAVQNIQSSPIFENCVFFNNKSSLGGNVINNESSIVTLINCTVVDNYHPSWSNLESIRSGDSNIIIKNSILWNNGSEFTNAAGLAASNYDVSFSDIKGGFTGSNNLDIDPQFKNPLNRDYSLKVYNPLYNKGTNAALTLTTDYAGASRILYGTVDIGAFEYITDKVYVNTAATGLNNGQTWTDAFVYLVDALDSLATTGTPAQVWVAQGTYHPYEIGHSISNNFRLESFKMFNNVEIYGGFLGYETTLNQRDYDLFPTILSSDLQDNDGTYAYSDNTYHVFFNNYTNANPLTSSAILDGFTIFGGYAKSTGINSTGGGMYNKYASPIIKNCRFQANIANVGGGMYNDYSNPNISNSSFYKNVGEIAGGALIAANGNPIINNTLFLENKVNTTNSNVTSYGGAIQLTSCGGSVSSCTFNSNSAYYYGGAARIQNSTTAFSSCNFTDNQAKSGGAIYMTSSILAFTNCHFYQNLSQNGPLLLQPIYHGGAISIIGGNVNLDDCTFTGNWTENNGGGVYFSNTTSLVNKCTFTDNLALYDDGDPNPVTPFGGAVFMESDTDVSISNCIFKNNRAQIGGGAVYNKSDNTSIENSLFVNNVAYEGIGGAIENEEASPTINNCTFADQNVIPFATIRNNNSSNPTIQNCIVWAKANTMISNFNGSTPVLKNCIVKGGYASGVNIQNTDPKFKDSLNADYTLQRCSPAIDIGENTYNSTVLDLNANARFFNAKQTTLATIDLGAYESQAFFQSNCDCPSLLTVSGNTNSSTIRTSESINSDATILAGQNITFGTNNFIELVPPFETQNGTVFKAEMNGCSN